MKSSRKQILMLFTALVVQFSFAQEKTITGKITDDIGSPLPGVNIIVKNTNTGTQSDFDGNYNLQASQGDILVFSYLGFTNKEVTVGTSDTVDIQLESSASQLEEVIVTAQGIKREKQALGYAVAEVKNEQLEQRAEGDIGRVLFGKASGVNITQQNGLSGSGTNIVIRGLSSFSGSNQPLFIVDGVPFSSDTNSQGSNDGNSQNDFVDGNSGSSRFLDLDPNSIESVNVLKGLAAATLYGTAGRNGVILITTKNGSAGNALKKNEVTITSSLFFNEIASLPDYQNQYGNGFDQAFGWFFSNWGPSFEREGVAGWGNGIDSDPNRGFNEDGTLAHPYSTAASATGIPAAFPEFAGARYEWRPYDSVENFFKTGTVANTAINFRGTSTDNKLSYNANYSYLEDEGFTPGNTLRRNTLGFGGKAVLSNKFTISNTLNYSKTDFRSPPVSASRGNGSFGTGSSVFGELFFTPRSVDLIGLPSENPQDGSSVYYRQNNSIQHPIWTVNNALNRQTTNRVFGNGTLQYDFTDNLNLIYRFGIDNYTESNINQQNKGGVSDDAALRSGIYQTWTNINTIFDHNIIINGNFALNDNIGMTFNVGGTSRREVFERNGVASSSQVEFDVFRHVNFLNQDEIEFKQERNIVGLYGQADFDYKKMLYLALAGRNDWVSNLTTENRSIFYPSASVSFLPTTAFKGLRTDNGINYLKVRAGYGTSANFPTGFPVAVTLDLDTQNFQNSDSGNDVVTNSIPPREGNPNLKPERLNEIEFGIESRFFKNRINLNASYYNRTTKDLIIDRPLDPSTGATIRSENIGEIKSDGFEVDLGVDIVKQVNNGFTWNTNINFTASETTVEDLGADTDIIVYSGFSNLGNAAIEGEPLGVIVGSRIQRNDNGEFLVNDAGNYREEEGTFVIGDPNPDYLLNVNNSFSFKNFNLSFLFTFVKGGDIYSRTVSTLLGRGLTTDTVDRENTFILPGVRDDGSQNNIQINNSTFYFSNVLFGPDELGVFDGTVLRLQELSLGYTIPTKFLDKTPFGAVSINLTGYNLWFDAFNIPDGTNFDPNVAGLGVGNGRGFDFLNGPSSRRYGMSIKASF
ncbi:SusC/RagA family TonB-linked outer membrane protein [Aquimarina algiphila]|uniref:SusC/RagA family TonB-linked outer membrane protein n=1 Tax=Aquimarina algiphila TaxID=2047982 RepID=A0A554VR45_9FLAO|nr:SusC/RagA family TonB-linked outer membrane protein [Aquimarina algiphila]TSE11087.1 SusC/RagA family TonB-linked outer membrane protein [Aquimarina algiphila]